MLNMHEDSPGRQGSAPGGWSLRLAAPADAAVLARAAALFFADTFGSANRPEDLDAYLAAAFTESRQYADLSAPNTRLWLAVDADDSIAGYVHVRLGAPLPPGASITSTRPAEIARLYADRRWHGRGLGASLMETGIATAREWKADVLWLGVWERNERAIAFYQKQGFQIVGAQEFMLGGDRQRDHVMARRLTAED
jgi:ribosomal protein S18 acetylase RimI-like enzyme